MALLSCDTIVDEKGLELLSHGTAEFPVGCYHDDLTTQAVPWHWHDELEIVIVAEGSAVIKAGAESYLVQAGDGVFTNSGIFHTDFNAGTDVCRFHSIVFHPVLVGGSYDSLFWQKYLRPILDDTGLPGIHLRQSVPWQKAALAAAERAWQSCVQETPGYPFAVRSALSQFIFLLYENRPAPLAQPDAKHLRDSQRMKQMLHYIAAHYGDPITLRQIAQSAALSQSECLRCFHNVIHTTPMKYLRDFRLQQAAEQLRADAGQIADVAQRCGFQEMSYFSKVFRQKYGCSPTEHRIAAK